MKRAPIRLECRVYDDVYGWMQWTPMLIDHDGHGRITSDTGQQLIEIRVMAAKDNLELMNDHYPSGMRQVMRW